MTAARAVVFAYHDVGVRCLAALLARGVEAALVVTHRDDPAEGAWFASVERSARERGLEVEAPDDPAGLHRRIAALAPDFLFSFHYRRLLSPALLALARRGAYNMHGSLLPRYRGRAPVNWAILRGERETGATLHEMVQRPDAGRIVDQLAVPILPDDVALDVMRKVTVAAELVLHRALPGLIDGSARLAEQRLAEGEYCGARRPEDGRIDWRQGARRIHDLVRAVAPPWPGAFTQVRGRRLRILRTRVLAERAAPGAARLSGDAGRLLACCADGGVLQVLECDLDGAPLAPAELRRRLGADPVPLGDGA
ncbi:MAG TPA: formyltransferase [Myxococcota bacterium]|nr:formyltransferase [Myxococcota bacterium]